MAPATSQCTNPDCNAHVIMASLLEQGGGRIKLHCSACDKVFTLDDTQEQRNMLRNKKNHPSQVDAVEYVSQLLSGDIIAFKRVAGAYEHHAIVTEVNRRSGKVTLVEFALNSPISKGAVKKREVDFSTEIASCNAFVRRYMPLDCDPVSKVISRAKGFADNPKSMPGYDAFVNNCQHLASYCKTGQRISEEGSYYEKWYGFIVKGAMLVLSFFEHPFIKIGNLIILFGSQCREGRVKDIKKALKNAGLEPDIEDSNTGEIMLTITGIAIILISLLIR